jgi:hypothetical protein
MALRGSSILSEDPVRRVVVYDPLAGQTRERRVVG